MKVWKKQQKLFKTLIKRKTGLRFGRKCVTPSDIGNQFYCEKKVHFSYIFGSTQTEKMVIGKEKHKKLVEDFKKIKPDQIWKHILKKDRSQVGELPLIAPYKDTFIFGRPDQIIFVKGKPYIVFEFKFSKYKMVFKSQTAQAQAYCMELHQLGFDTSMLHYCVIVSPIEMKNKMDYLKTLPKIIFDKFLQEDFFLNEENIFTYDDINVYIYHFNEKSADEDMGYALQYWRQERDPVPTDNRNKCMTCEFLNKCLFGKQNIREFQPPQDISSIKRLSVGRLPNVRETREVMLNELGYAIIGDIVKVEPSTLWNQILTHPKGKKVFQREIDVRKIIYTARALIQDKPIALHPKIHSLDLNLGDAFYDSEYMAHKINPTFFSISIGILKEDGVLKTNNLFAKEAKESKSIVQEFYNFLEENKIKRLLGWGINSADNPMLKKIAPLPDFIEYVDIYNHIINQLALPVFSTRLKPIYAYITQNLQNQTQIKGGRDAVNIYREYIKTNNPVYKQQIIDYNIQDVLMTYRIALWFESSIGVF